MDKSSKKKAYNKYNPAIINQLISKYNVSVQFVQQALRGERTSVKALEICEEYKKMERIIHIALQS